MKKTKRFCAVLLSVLLVTMLLPFSVLAAEQIDPERDVSLTISYSKENQAFADVVFDLYQVASVDANGNYTLTEDFKDCPVRLEDLNESNVQAYTQTLEEYVQQNKLVPLDSGATDENGELTFPNQQSSLKPGVYLVLGQMHTHGKTVYTPQPMLITLPVWDEDGFWNYVVTAHPKPDTDEPETPSVTPTPRPTNPTLPQTGQLWWPVPVLAFAGLALVLLGLLRRRS